MACSSEGKRAPVAFLGVEFSVLQSTIWDVKVSVVGWLSMQRSCRNHVVMLIIIHYQYYNKTCAVPWVYWDLPSDGRTSAQEGAPRYARPRVTVATS